MRTIIVAPLIATLATVVTQPAAAQQYQTTIQVHYWSAGFGGGPGSIAATDPASTWGARLRLDSKTTQWAFSGGFDSMSVTPTTWLWNGATLWDANVHYRFGSNLDSYLGVFLGYGRISLNSPSPPQVGSTSGCCVPHFMRQVRRGHPGFARRGTVTVI